MRSVWVLSTPTKRASTYDFNSGEPVDPCQHQALEKICLKIVNNGNCKFAIGAANHGNAHLAEPLVPSKAISQLFASSRKSCWTHPSRAYPMHHEPCNIITLYLYFNLFHSLYLVLYRKYLSTFSYLLLLVSIVLTISTVWKVKLPSCQNHST